MNISKITSNRPQNQTNFGINPRQAESLKKLSTRIAKLPETDEPLGRTIIQRLENLGFPKIEADPAKPRDFLIGQFNLLHDGRDKLSYEYATYPSYPDLFSQRMGDMEDAVSLMETIIENRKFVTHA